MKTLVTGGTGLLGANLIRELLRRGHRVRVLVRDNSSTFNLNLPDVEFYRGDLTDEPGLFRACCGCDQLIHAAALMPGHSCRFADYFNTNVKGTINIVRAAEKAGFQRMVYVSSCCAFAGGSKEHPGTELSDYKGFRFNSPYIDSKYLAQQWLLYEFEKKDIPLVIVNPTVLIGPYGPLNGFTESIINLVNQKVRFCPSGGKNFIDVQDAAVATCNALCMGTPGECYLLASENLTFAEFFSRIRKVCQTDGIEVPVPGFILNGLGLAGSWVGKFSGRPALLNLSNSKQLTNHSYFSGVKAVRELGLVQRPVDDAIRLMLAWYQHEKKEGSTIVMAEKHFVSA